MTKETIEAILGRPMFNELAEYELNFDGTILITGAEGSIGKEIVKRIKCKHLILTDIHNMDVTNVAQVSDYMQYEPDLIIHLAGAKHAPEGEVNVSETININTIGTQNLLNHKPKHCKLVLTSTCKACNPETVYGATKLIAERLVLNAGGNVARFFNVIETQGNVFELWQNQNPKKLAFCERHFICIQEAVGLILFTCTQPKGRYSVNTPILRHMVDVFKAVYPNLQYETINPRRGDRVRERFKNTSEEIESKHLNNSVIKVLNHHD